MRAISLSGCLAAVLITVTSCQAPARRPAADAAGHPGLEHVLPMGDGVINGSAPHDDEGFDSLVAMGVKTVVCVDGATPDAAAAETRGMRYVHLPIGYDGITDEESLELAKAVHDLPKPIYIHCHHGVYRGPAAAACALVRLGEISPAEGEELLVKAGTSPNYPGLFEAVRNAPPVSAAELAAAPADFPAHAAVSDLASAMAQLDRTWDHINALKATEWKVPAGHPDLDPANETRILAEQLQHVANLPEITDGPADKVTWMKDAVRDANGLATAVAKSRFGDATQQFAALSKTCSACHARYRNRK